MELLITGRNVNVSEKFKGYAEKKVAKLEKYFHQILDTRLIMFTQKLDHIVEIVIYADGVQFYGSEKSGDFYSSIDLLIDKLERQVKKYKEKQEDHSNIALGELPVSENNDESVMQIKLNEVNGKPIDEIEAYLEMKVDNSEFILFKKGVRDINTDIDYANKYYALLYRDNDKIKMVEIPYEKIKNNDYNHTTILEYDLEVIEDSISNPVIECKQNNDKSISAMKVTDAILEFSNKNTKFLPFFNSESKAFNVIYYKGKNIEIAVPARH